MKYARSSVFELRIFFRLFPLERFPGENRVDDRLDSTVIPHELPGQ
jgi:hypothetical protein